MNQKNKCTSSWLPVLIIWSSEMKQYNCVAKNSKSENPPSRLITQSKYTTLSTQSGAVSWLQMTISMHLLRLHYFTTLICTAKINCCIQITPKSDRLFLVSRLIPFRQIRKNSSVTFSNAADRKYNQPTNKPKQEHNILVLINWNKLGGHICLSVCRRIGLNATYLLWCEYSPVACPVPSQPGVGHLLSPGLTP